MKVSIQKFFKDQRRLFVVLLVSIAMIITIVLQIQSIVLFYMYKDEALSMTNVFAKSNLSLTSYSANYLNDTARMLAMQLFMDKDIQPVMTQTPSSEISQAESSRFVNRLILYVGIMPYIDSIYVYNGFTKNIYCVNGDASYISSNESDFFDSGILSIIKNVKNSRYIIPRNRKTPVKLNKNDTQYTGVYSYIISNVSIDHEKVESSVIINIKESWLVDLINSMSEDSKSSKTIMINKDGRIIASPEEKDFDKNISDEAYVRKVLQSKSPSGYFVQSINEENYVVTYVNLNGQDFKFIKLTPYKIVQQNTLKIRNSIIAVTLIILILGLIIITFLSLGAYKPFKKLFKTKQALESFKRQNLYNIKEKLLLQFLTSANSNSINYWNEQFAELQIKLNLSKKLMLCVFKIDHYPEFAVGKTERDLNLSLFSICNIAGEIFSDRFNNEPVITGDDHITLILEVGMDEKPSHELLEKAQMMIKQYLDISVTITTSHKICNLDELSFQYNETLEMSNYRFLKGHASIITPDDVPETTDLYYKYPYAKEQDLINDLMIHKIANVKQTYLEIVESIQYCPSYEIQSILNHLTIIINKTIKNMKSLLNIEFSFNMNLFNNELNSKETLCEINDLFISLFDKLEDEISSHSSSKSNTKYVKMIEDAKKYIDDNYCDTNLSLASVADYFCSSSEYFGRLFRKYASLSVQDYINQIRLNAAKKLLEGNDVQASEVYSRVGFVNKSHFYAFFKKSTGVTPGEYRDQAASI